MRNADGHLQPCDTSRGLRVISIVAITDEILLNNSLNYNVKRFDNFSSQPSVQRQARKSSSSQANAYKIIRRHICTEQQNIHGL